MQHDILTDYKKIGGISPIIFGWDERAINTRGVQQTPFYLIHYVVSGHGYFFIHGKKYNIGPGDLFVIPPLAKHEYFEDDADPWGYMWIGFNIEGELPVNIGDVIHFPEAKHIFEKAKEVEKMTSGVTAFLNARIWDLFSILPSGTEGNEDIVSKALDIIHNEYRNNITVESISNRLNVNRCYLSTIFKEKIGTSPKHYLVLHRMMVASQLLAIHKRSVSSTAYSVGYEDVFNFSKIFKKYYRMSPSQYAKEAVFDFFGAGKP